MSKVKRSCQLQVGSQKCLFHQLNGAISWYLFSRTRRRSDLQFPVQLTDKELICLHCVSPSSIKLGFCSTFEAEFWIRNYSQLYIFIYIIISKYSDQSKQVTALLNFKMLDTSRNRGNLSNGNLIWFAEAVSSWLSNFSKLPSINTTVTDKNA